MNQKLKRIEKGLKYLHIFLVLLFITTNVYAANDDPLSVINNLSDFIFSIMKVAGALITGFGIMQFGLSFKTQDPSQRTNSYLQILGGVIVYFAKDILNIITK